LGQNSHNQSISSMRCPIFKNVLKNQIDHFVTPSHFTLQWCLPYYIEPVP
jgi:hypothetical protein